MSTKDANGASTGVEVFGYGFLFFSGTKSLIWNFIFSNRYNMRLGNPCDFDGGIHTQHVTMVVNNNTPLSTVHPCSSIIDVCRGRFYRVHRVRLHAANNPAREYDEIFTCVYIYCLCIIPIINMQLLIRSWYCVLFLAWFHIAELYFCDFIAMVSAVCRIVLYNYLRSR